MRRFRGMLAILGCLVVFSTGGISAVGASETETATGTPSRGDIFALYVEIDEKSDSGDIAGALAEARRAESLARNHLHIFDPLRLKITDILASLLRDREQWIDAELAYRRALDIRFRTRRFDDDYVWALTRLGETLLMLERDEEASNYLAAAWTIERPRGKNDRLFLETAGIYARILAVLGRYEEAEAIVDQGLAVAEAGSFSAGDVPPLLELKRLLRRVKENGISRKGDPRLAVTWVAPEDVVWDPEKFRAEMDGFRERYAAANHEKRYDDMLSVVRAAVDWAETQTGRRSCETGEMRFLLGMSLFVMNEAGGAEANLLSAMRTLTGCGDSMVRSVAEASVLLGWALSDEGRLFEAEYRLRQSLVYQEWAYRIPGKPYLNATSHLAATLVKLGFRESAFSEISARAHELEERTSGVYKAVRFEASARRRANQSVVEVPRWTEAEIWDRIERLRNPSGSEHPEGRIADILRTVAAADDANVAYTQAGAHLLLLLCDAYRDASDYANAEIVANRGKRIVENLDSPNSSQVALFTERLADIAEKKGDHDRAQALADRTAVLNAGGRWRPERWYLERDVAHGLAAVLASHHRFDDAAKEYARELEIVREAGMENAHLGASIRVDLGIALREQGKIAEAEESFKRALKFFGTKQGGIDQYEGLQANLLGNYAHLLELEGRLATARALYRDAGEKEKKRPSPENDQILKFEEGVKRIDKRLYESGRTETFEDGGQSLAASILFFRSSLEGTLGEIDEETLGLARALETIAIQHLPAGDGFRILASVTVWELMKDLGDLGQANAHLANMLESLGDEPNVEGGIVGGLHFALAGSYESLGDSEKSFFHLQACARRLGSLTAYTPTEEDIRLLCSKLYAKALVDRDRYREAAPYFEMLANAYEEKLGAVDILVLDARLDLARCRYAIEDWEASAAEYRRIYSSLEDMRYPTSEHPPTYLSESASRLAEFLSRSGRVADARDILSNTLKRLKNVKGIEAETQALRDLHAALP